MNGEQEQDGPHRRLVAWRGRDPERVDVAQLELRPDRLTARGTSTTADYVVTYRLQTGPRWVTRSLDVRVERDDGWRSMALHRTKGDGSWSAAWNSSRGPGEVVALADLRPALDCDLGLCPVTNTMPVLREGILAASQGGEPRRAELTMAWVAVPELEVVVSSQTYESGTPVFGGGAQVRYCSSGFSEHIEVDADGVVVNYPSIGRLVVG